MGESSDNGDEDTTDSLTDQDLADIDATVGGPTGEGYSTGTSFGVSLGYDAQGNALGTVSATGSTQADIDIGFSDGKGGPGDNFSAFGGITDAAGNPVGKEAQSPSEVAATMDAISVDQALNDAVASSPVAGVNQGITAAGVSPTFSGAIPSDVFDPTTMTDRSGKTAPSAIEQAAMDAPGLDAFGPVAPGFSPVGITPSVTKDELPSITQSKGIQAALSNLDIAKDKAAAKGIDFGVTAPVDAFSTDRSPGMMSAVFGPEAASALGGLTVNEAMGLAGITDPSQTGTIDPADIPGAVSAITGLDQTASGTVAPSDFTGLMSTRDPAGTTLGVSPAPPGFEEKVGKDFDPGKMAQMEAIMATPNVMPGIFGIVEDKTKDALATSIALGRNVTPMEAIFGYTAPDMTKDKETIEEFNARTGASIPPDQIVTDSKGTVIGLKDAMGNLVTGRDPSAQAQASEEGRTEEEMREKPKSPTDPCPEGYQLIDGKCTPTEEVVTDTGFVVFPAGRVPPFRTGPFTPATVASNPGIRGLNPITFNIPPNPFKR